MSAPHSTVRIAPDPPVRGQRLFVAAESAWLRITRALRRNVPEELDPLSHTGAIANTSLLVAVASGVLLLLWYSPSVGGAWPSVAQMAASPFTGGLVRSIHRYSSDGCMLFVILHALQLTLQRRFTGARWVAWVTGVVLVATLWFVGWLGYWLVWDDAAHLVALSSARLADQLPVFSEPLSRSFLTDAHVNSMLFFMVFFLHMLLPLVLGIAAWLHITRLARPRFLASKAMTIWIVASLVLVSLVAPATLGAPARMTVPPAHVVADAWYLLPLGIAARLSGGAAWALVLFGGMAVVAVPWALARGRAPVAQVDESKCNSCRQCFEDCPFDAISMVPRTDGRAYESRSLVDPAACVGCGICAGSCNSAAIGLARLPVLDVRARIEAWVESVTEGGEKPFVAFVCASSAGAALRFDPETGACAELPAWRVLEVPCSGWVHALTIERLLRRGTRGVLVASCGPGEPPYREGARWTADRLAATREPPFRAERVPNPRVAQVKFDRTRVAAFLEAARAFERGRDPAGPPPTRPRAIAVVSAFVLAALGLVAAGSRLPYGAPVHESPRLVVSFTHPGRAGENCRKLSEEEKLALPVHMRRDEVCERGRAPVRLRVEVDGRVLLEQAYAPRGLSGDGASVVMESLDVAPGAHEVALAIGETRAADEWSYRESRRMDFAAGENRVVLFDRMTGFSWYGGSSGKL